MLDLLAQQAVESGYDLLRNRQARGSTVLIPAVLPASRRRKLAGGGRSRTLSYARWITGPAECSAARARRFRVTILKGAREYLNCIRRTPDVVCQLTAIPAPVIHPNLPTYAKCRHDNHVPVPVPSCSFRSRRFCLLRGRGVLARSMEHPSAASGTGRNFRWSCRRQRAGRKLHLLRNTQVGQGNPSAGQGHRCPEVCSHHGYTISIRWQRADREIRSDYHRRHRYIAALQKEGSNRSSSIRATRKSRCTPPAFGATGSVST